LVFLLALAIAGLAFLGFHAFQLRTRATYLDAELVAQQARYDKDIKQWNDFSVTVKARHNDLVNKYNEKARKWNEYATALKTENQRLSKWKNVADADVKAAEMLRSARATLEKAKADANNL